MISVDPNSIPTETGGGLTPDAISSAEAESGGLEVSPRRSVLSQAAQLGLVFWVSVVWLLLLIGAAVLAPVLPLPAPERTAFTCAGCPPGDGALLGGDSLGRDIFSRLVYGARVSLSVGVLSAALGLIVGGPLGLVAGYRRGRVERLIMTVVDILLAFPPLILLLAFVTFVADNNAGVIHVGLAIGVLSIAPMCRLVRSLTLSIAEREFVIAARAIGAKTPRILLREIVPNVIAAALAFALTAVAYSIVAEGGLAFLGLSVRPPTPTWGGMFNDGRLALRDSPHVALVPAVVMLITILALNYASDALSARSRRGSVA